MIQFTREECERLRARSRKYPKTIQKLKDGVAPVYQGEIIVPETGIANWTLYYYCPDCSVQLTFDRHSGKAHRCPSCGKVWTGEPYDSSWWGKINMQNYTAVFDMAIIWLATGEESYARKAIEILCTYAKHYPDYEVHGDIPYNGPGRSGAQTLDEANFQRTFAMSYDILSELMSEEERVLVRDNMFLPGAEFLLAHRHRQLHNHEVIINSAIAVIGMLFERTDFVEAALYEDYGIRYQLEHGMLPNRMWFEGAFGYHFYALTSFYAFEKFALHTRYSSIQHPNYKAMMELLCDYMEPDYGIPMLNDTNYGHLENMKNLYEFAYREIGGEKLAFVLNTYYKKQDRDNLEAFLYGVEELPELSLPLADYHTPVNAFGHTILRGADDRYLLLKHDSYGGEHDHYDRLAFSYLAYGRPVSRDLGTTGYGARMHYDYYKNTGSHNTLVIGEENQAPVNGRLTAYEVRDGYVYVAAEADWTAPYTMPDSFTIVQWSEENYKSVKMERKIAWAPHYFVEVMRVNGVPEGCSADWVMHINGSLQTPEEAQEALPAEYFTKKPFKYLKGAAIAKTEAPVYRRVYTDGDVETSVYGMHRGQMLISAMGPDNPSTGEICYQLERAYGNEQLYAHVIESSRGDAVVQQVRFEQTKEGLLVVVTEKDGTEKNYTF